jgi:hypothetical protein
MDPGTRRQPRILLKIAFACALFLAALEVACQVYAAVLDRRWDAVRNRPEHYYRASANPVLGYELKPECSVEKDGRILRINRFGVRDDSDSVPAAGRRIAVLGDSLTFGTGFSQAETIPALLQQRLDPEAKSVRVLNLGVPGYNLPELVEQLRIKDAIYHFTKVIYLLNANDFCRRNSIYEGADNGLYRLYNLPRLKSPWCLRKLVYRAHKGGLVSPGWYRWVYRGARDQGLSDLAAMALYCEGRGAGFSVVLLPAGCAYSGGDYQLSTLCEDITSSLQAGGIAVTNLVSELNPSAKPFFTDTDHLLPAGNRVVADALARLAAK